MAAQENHVDIARFLLANGADQSLAAKVSNNHTHTLTYCALSFDVKSDAKILVQATLMASCYSIVYLLLGNLGCISRQIPINQFSRGEGLLTTYHSNNAY
jgi:ankyrin repeat protein